MSHASHPGRATAQPDDAGPRDVRRGGSAPRQRASAVVTSMDSPRELAPVAPQRDSSGFRRWFIPATAIVLGGLALVSLRADLHAARYRQLRFALRALPTSTLWLAALVTIAAYAVLPAYDLLALRYVRRPIGFARTATTSLVAYAFSQTIGLASLTSASIRYRFWTASGLSGIEVAQGVAFTTVSLWLGIATVGGAGLAFGTLPPGGMLSIAPLALRALGVALLLIPAAYFAWCASNRRPIAVGKWRFDTPNARIAALQILASSVDWLLAAAVLYVLLAPLGVRFWTLVPVFVMGQLLGLASHVPGGLGVFESVVIASLRSAAPAEQILPPLVAYRAIYYLFPFLAGVAGLASYELTRKRGSLVAVVRMASRWVPGAIPYFLSITTFAAGLLLMFSGATPAIHARLRWLDAFFPLAVIEVSHFAASVAGVILILLANGIRRRLDAAYHLTVLALVVGIAGSLLKGADYEEALALIIVLAAFLPARSHFFRRAALTSEPLTPGWIAALALAIVATLWLGLFSYGQTGFSNDLWWRFATAADAPRFLRAMAGTTAVVVAFTVARLMRPAKARGIPPAASDLARAKEVAMTGPDVRAHLALLGDKSLLFSETGRSFIMYGVSGRSWVALGDPIGPPTEHSELAWRFHELAHRHGGWPVFYQVSRDMLPLCIDLGLTLLKLGEEAHVPLANFTLEGGSRRGLRRTMHEVERSGASFEIVGPEYVERLLPELEAVSSDWLAAKQTREKGFSLGFFDPEYLSHFPLALARRDGHIVAFANIWTSDARETASADLMRFSSDAPRGVMEYLFVRLMQWARSEGYSMFDLGMAPLSGFEPRALAPAWHRLGRLVYRHGEHFYHFRGLRQYKEKFDPVWEPRYLGTPGGLAIPRILASVTSLVSGGLSGVVRK
jgi:phosphatidylglycerol lysyltransferase